MMNSARAVTAALAGGTLAVEVLVAVAVAEAVALTVAEAVALAEVLSCWLRL
jgi:hypothetical protein